MLGFPSMLRAALALGTAALFGFSSQAVASPKGESVVSVEITTPDGAGPYTESDIPRFEFVFSESVLGFDAADDLLITSDGDASYAQVELLGSGSTYQVRLFGLDGSGTITMAVNPGSDAQGALSGSPLDSTPSASISVEATQPIAPPAVLDIATSEPNPTGNNALVFDVLFSKPVVNFDAEAVQLNYPAVTAEVEVSGGPVYYQVSLSVLFITADLSITILSDSDIRSEQGQLLDADFTGPEIFIDAARAFLTRVEADVETAPEKTPIQVEAEFSRPVSGFDEADMLLLSLNGVDFLVREITGGPSVYQILLSVPTGPGQVDISLRPDHGIVDTYGRDLLGPYPSATVTLENETPTLLSLERNGTGVVTDAAVTLDVEFDLPVKDLDAADFSVNTVGASHAPLAVSGGPLRYTLTLDGLAGEGTLSVGISDGFNATGFDGDAIVTEGIAPVDIAVDRVLPQVLSIESVAPRILDGEEAVFNLLFSEPVSGVETGSFDISGAATFGAASITGEGATYQLVLEDAVGEGDITVALAPAAGIVDAAGNALATSDLSATVTVSFDRPQLLSITPLDSAPHGGSSASFELLFNRPVIQVDPADFDVTTDNPALTFGALQVTGEGVAYIVAVEELTGEGVLRLALAAENDVADGEGLGLSPFALELAAELLVDRVAPLLLSIEVEQENIVSGANAVYQLTFDEPVSGVSEQDFRFVNEGVNIASFQVQGEGTVYEAAALGVTGAGLVRLGLAPEATIQDAAGNAFVPGEALYAVSVSLEQPNLLSIAPITQSPSNANRATFRVTFDRAVINVDPSDFIAEGDTPALTTGSIAITGTGAIYDVAVLGLEGAGQLLLRLAPGNDIALQGGLPLPESSLALSGSLLVDRVAPLAVRFDPVAGRVEPGGNAVFRVAFDEPVTGFDAAADIQLTGVTGDAPAITILPVEDEYEVTIGPLAGPARVEAGIAPATNARDAAGNFASAAGARGAVAVAEAGPYVVSIGEGIVSPTRENPLVVEVRFSEAVQGVDPDDFSVTASGGSFNRALQQIAPDTYLLSLTPRGLAVGTVRVRIEDGAGIENLSGLPLTVGAATPLIQFDYIPPTFTMIALDPVYANPGASIRVRFQFSEPLLSFTPGDIVVLADGNPVSATVSLAPSLGAVVATIGGLPQEVTESIRVNVAPGLTDLAGSPLGPQPDLVIPVDFGAPRFLGFDPPDGRLQPGAPSLRLRFSKLVRGVRDAAASAYPATISVAPESVEPASEVEFLLSMGGASTGLFEIHLDENVRDVSGAPIANPGPKRLRLIYDIEGPRLLSAQSVPPPPYLDDSPVRFDFVFDEPVSLLNPATSLQLFSDGLTNASVVLEESLAPERLSVRISPGSGEGALEVFILEGSIVDRSGNVYPPGLISPTLQVDTTPPDRPSVSAFPAVILPGGLSDLSIAYNEPLAAPPLVISLSGDAQPAAGELQSGNFIYGFEADPAAQPGDVNLRITATDNYGRSSTSDHNNALDVALSVNASILSPTESPLAATGDARPAYAEEDGRVVVVWQSRDESRAPNGRRIMGARSEDGGETWSAPFFLLGPTPQAPALPIILQSNPTIAVTGGLWVASWLETDLVAGQSGAPVERNGRVVVSRSVDGGATWSAARDIAAVPVASVNAPDTSAPSLAFEPNGWLLAWINAGQVYVVEGTSNAFNWGNPTLLGGGGAAAHARIAVDGFGGAVAAWTNKTLARIEAAHRIARGGGWNAPAPLTDDNWSAALATLLSTGQASYVAVVEGGPLSGKGAGDTDLYIARSVDAGASWSAPLAVYDSASDQAEDQHATLNVQGDAWVMAWVAAEAEGIAVRRAYSFDAGITWSPVESLLPLTEREVGWPSLLSEDGAWHLLRSEQAPDSRLMEIIISEIAAPVPPDAVAPAVNSLSLGEFDRQNRAQRFDIVFSEPVRGLEVADFEIRHLGTAHAGLRLERGDSAAVWALWLENFEGDGRVQLRLLPGSVFDLAGNPFALDLQTPFFAIDAAPPRVLRFEKVLPGPIVGGDASFLVEFDSPVTGFTAREVPVELRDVAYARITVTGSGAAYQVNLIGARGNGWIRLGVGGNGALADLSGNVLREVAWGPGVLVNTGIRPLRNAAPPEGLDFATADSLLAQLLQGFAASDEDGNRALDWREALNALPSLGISLFTAVDTNRDGALTVAEIRAFSGQGAVHQADTNADGRIALDELLRIIQLYNAGGYACAGSLADSEDGFIVGAPGAGGVDCLPHSADFLDANNQISLSELLRMIQYYNAGLIRYCPGEASEDTFCAE